jgi:HAMP domain-containing protein
MTTSAQAGPARAPRYKRSVRNYLIDSRFQLKYTGLIVALSIVIGGSLGVFLYRSSQTVVDEGRRVSEQSRALMEETKKVSEVTKMNMKDLGYDNPDLTAAFDSEASAHDKAIVDQEMGIVRQQESLIHQQSVVLWSLVGALSVMVILIGLLGIYFTHKVAGPIYKMRRLLKEVGEGRLAIDTRVRKGDELQDFFGAFTSMVDSLRARHTKTVEQLDRAIGLATTAGATQESLKSVVTLRDEMKAQLD